MKLRKKTISATEAVKLALGPEKFFQDEYVPREILNENTVIHKMLGADNMEEVELELPNGWVVKGIPDKILDDRVVEVKVQRPLSKPEELLIQGAHQALIYAKALGLGAVEVWLYVYSNDETNIYTYAVDELEPDRFFDILVNNLNQFYGFAAFRPTIKKKLSENKLALRAVKWTT